MTGQSYQDVDWGYHGSWGTDALTTEAPIPLAILIDVLNSIGYQLKPADPYSPRPQLVWIKPSAPPITLLRPQFAAEGHKELVYDRNDLVDFFWHFHGNDVDGVEILAKIREC